MASNRGKVHSISLFVEKLLAKIDSLWGKLAFIGVIFCVGAKAGGYYTETKMTKCSVIALEMGNQYHINSCPLN